MDEAKSILPGWFSERIMQDVWAFGLLMSDGTIISIQAIEAINQASDGSIWLDVRLMDPSDGMAGWLKNVDKKLVAPTDRLKASINASHVMAAFELANT